MKLFIENGMTIAGEPFGASGPGHGELVFTTGMTGYVESLTDPSYAGQILVMTYPLIGNYGVPDPERYESSCIHAAGLIVSEYCDTPSHHDSRRSLSRWLQDEGVPALQGVDTRGLTRMLREHGTMRAHLSSKRPDGYVNGAENLVARVSPRDVSTTGSGRKTIVLIDCGAKESIARSLLREDVTLLRVPWDYDLSDTRYDGLVISNGPGDPMRCTETIQTIRSAFERDVPILGICLGNQLLALAAGATTYKLPYGHRSHNQPCRDVLDDRVYITSQNHGYAVESGALPPEWRMWFTNENDGSNEGIRHLSRPWRSVQFHPEAAPGPTDTAWIFDDFIDDVMRRV
jgi:carbamoyl-phosphate synthase small subunit